MAYRKDNRRISLEIVDVLGEDWQRLDDGGWFGLQVVVCCYIDYYECV